MCTRYVFTDPAEAIREWFKITGPLPNWPPNYNVASTHIMPVIRPIDGGREIAMMEWGLIPFFSKDGKRSFTTFNARGEELHGKPMYREPFKTRRCIVPATGYIEFTGPKGEKQAHLFTRTDGKPIALGGLWDGWTSADKAERKETYTVITTAPSAFAGQFHDRMPLVLEMEDVEGWLRASPDHAAALMRPAKDVLQHRPLGKAINNVKNSSLPGTSVVWRLDCNENASCCFGSIGAAALTAQFQFQLDCSAELTRSGHSQQVCDVARSTDSILHCGQAVTIVLS